MPSRTEEGPAGGGLAFLCFQSGEPGQDEWAALLVVNAYGLPQEFLYSGPLRPTPVQSILYQDWLPGQVRQSLVRSLLRGMRSRPAALVLDAAEVDRTPYDEFRVPVLCVEGEAGRWLTPAVPAAEALCEALADTLGLSEPAGRVRAALAYVVEYERQRSG